MDAELAEIRDSKRDLQESIARLRTLNTGMGGVRAVIERKQAEYKALEVRERDVLARHQDAERRDHTQREASIHHVGRLWSGWR